MQAGAMWLSIYTCPQQVALTFLVTHPTSMCNSLGTKGGWGHVKEETRAGTRS